MKTGLTCIDRIRNKQNLVTDYILKSYDTGKIGTFTADCVRKAMMSGGIVVDNLKLSKTCSILMLNSNSEVYSDKIIVDYVIQDLESARIYRESIKDSENREPNQEEAESLRMIGGYYVNWGNGTGTINQAIADSFSMACDEYEEYGYSKAALRKKVGKLTEIDDAMRSRELPTNKEICNYSHSINIEVYSSSGYKHYWRILIKKREK